jgi:hypothetical protein
MPTGPAREYGRARPRYVVPLIALGFLAALMIWVLVSPGQGGSRSPAPPQHRVSHVVRPPTVLLPAPKGSPTALEESVPDAPPNGITWQIIDTVALPFSDNAGPSQVTDGIPSGFAHTPTGALVALVQIDFRHLIEPNFVAVTTADVSNTAGRAEFFRLVKAGRLANPASPAPGTYLQLAGFEFVSYTSSNAVIQLLTARPDGTYQVSTLSVAWDGTDWQLVLQPNGTDSPNQQIVATPVGFVLWGGV